MYVTLLSDNPTTTWTSRCACVNLKKKTKKQTRITVSANFPCSVSPGLVVIKLSSLISLLGKFLFYGLLGKFLFYGRFLQSHSYMTSVTAAELC